MTSRERFEAWAKKRGISRAILRGEYTSPSAIIAWEAWQAACPDGYRCVPQEPTEEMLDNAWNECGTGSRQDYIESYTAMLSAAPKPRDL